jgi:hypothetical protein
MGRPAVAEQKLQCSSELPGEEGKRERLLPNGEERTASSPLFHQARSLEPAERGGFLLLISEVLMGHWPHPLL